MTDVPRDDVFVAGAAVGSFYGGGKLVVGHDATVYLSADAVTRRFTGVERVVHGPETLVVFVPRLFPPWLNTFIWLEGVHGRVKVGLPGWSRGRLRRALDRVGIDYEEVRTWVQNRPR